jgi:hypothetical protein
MGVQSGLMDGLHSQHRILHYETELYMFSKSGGGIPGDSRLGVLSLATHIWGQHGLMS